MPLTAWIQVVVLITGIFCKDHFETEDQLHSDLLQHYRHTSRPAASPTDTVEVNIVASDFRIEDVDDYANTMTSSFMISMSWVDVRLKWNDTDYDGIDRTTLPVENLWTPDLSVYNKVPSSDDLHHGYRAIVSSNGKVTTVTHVSITTFCSLDVTYYPYDEHTCKIVMGSWTSHGGHVSLKLPYGSEVFTWDKASDHPSWESVDDKVNANVTTKKYACCPEIYQKLIIKFQIQRRENFSRYLIIAPSVVFAFLLPVLFLLPSASHMKSNFGLLLILALTMMFVILENSVSFQHSTIPRLAVFYLIILIMAAVSVTLSAIILSMLERGSKGRPLPAWLKTLTFGRFGMRRILCMEHISGDTMYSSLSMKQLEENQDLLSEPIGTGTEMISTTSTLSDVHLGEISRATRIMAGKVIADDTIMRNSEEWVEFARVVDNLLFIVFLFVLVVVLASFGFK